MGVRIAPPHIIVEKKEKVSLRTQSKITDETS